jgi:hypothetical protein
VSVAGDELNWELLEQAINRAFDKLVARFEELQVEQLEAVKWEWFRATTRKSGQVVTTPRDIVDTGSLRDSLDVTPIDNNEVKYQYGESYAGLVHQGYDGVGKTGSPESYPARPWVVGAYEENDLLEIFKEYLEEELK